MKKFKNFECTTAAVVEIEILPSHYFMFIEQWFGVFFNEKS